MPTTPTHVNRNWTRDRQKTPPPQASLHYDTAIWENQGKGIADCGFRIADSHRFTLQSAIRNPQSAMELPADDPRSSHLKMHLGAGADHERHRRFMERDA